MAVVCISNQPVSVCISGGAPTPVTPRYSPVSPGQGTVLGPILFLIYINDIVNSCDSYIRLFADDTVICRNISSSADHDLLQHDLDNLETWAAILQMSFNATKCKLLSITHKKKQSEFAYSF